MKFEKLRYDYTLENPEIDPGKWDVKKWRNDNPVDYFKMMSLINNTDNDVVQFELFKVLFQITRLYLPDVLYKYYSLSEDQELNSKKISTLSEDKIYMAAAKELNDPFDSKGFFYDPSKLEDIEYLDHVGGRIVDDFSNFTRSTSLTTNGVQSMPMWAHYANNHKGFCISYDVNAKENIDLKSCTYPIQYTEERIDVTSFVRGYVERMIDEAERQASEGKTEIILTDSSIVYMQSLFCNIKHSSWSYENEFRCTIAEGAPNAPFISARAKEVFVGKDCNNEMENELIEVARKKQIPISKMIFDDLSERYRMVEKKIEL